MTATLATVFSVGLMFAFGPAITQAQTVRVGIGFSQPEQALTVGDPFPLTISAIHPEGRNIIFPRLPAQWGSFEVLSQEPVATIVNDDGTLTTSQIIEVALFAPGEHTTPPMTIKIQQHDSSIVEQSVRPISVSIISVLQSDDTEMRDIKPPAEVSVPSLWPWAAGGASAIGLLALAAFLLWQRRAASEMAARSLAVRSAFEIAMDQLDAIQKLDLPASGYFKQHHTLVADTLRGYLYRQFGLPALDLTTAETTLRLRDSRVPSEEHNTMTRFLRECDLIKFTELQPDVDSSWDMAHDIRASIRRLRPQLAKSPISEATS